MLNCNIKFVLFAIIHKTHKVLLFIQQDVLNTYFDDLFSQKWFETK